MELRERIKGLSAVADISHESDTQHLQDEFMIDSYGSCDTNVGENKEAKIAELELRLLKTYQLLEKIKGLPSV